MDWQARLPGRLYAMTGGETPAAFGCLLDAAVPVRPLALGTSTAFAERYPGHGREVGDFRRSYRATCGYLFALSAEGAMRHDLDGRPVAAVSKADRARAAAWLASPWVSGNRAEVGLDRRGVERYRVSGYGDEEEARWTLEFHPAGTGLAYEVRFEGEGT